MTFNKGDSIKKSSTKEGTSNSKLNFLKEDDDFEEISNEELEQFEVEETEYDEDNEDDEDYSSENILEEEIDEVYTQKQEEKIVKTDIVVLPRKQIKKPEFTDNPKLKSVSKQANKLLKEYASDISEEEIDKFLNLNNTEKEQMINGPLQFMNKNFSENDKKEMINKIDNIKSSDIISRTNAAFVLKWLKKRSK
jgi:hypothetical protein